MTVLKNPKHEKFCQELAKGKSQSDAYITAGYSGDDAAIRANASRLIANDKVAARLRELQEKAVVRHEVTIDSLRDMFLEDRLLARELGQSAAAVSATDKLARLYGHMIERKEVGGPGDFDRMTEDELEEFIASRENRAGEGSGRTRSASGSSGVRGKPSGLH